MSLSTSQTRFLHDGFCQNFRNDGRSNKQFRPRQSRLNVLLNCVGSSIVTVGDVPKVVDSLSPSSKKSIQQVNQWVLSSDTTVILCGIKPELRPYDAFHDTLNRTNKTTPQSLKITSPFSFSVQLVETAFPFSLKSTKDTITNQLEILLSKLYEKMPHKPFLLENSSSMWVCYIDCVVLSHGGNLLDNLSIAVATALSSVRFPPIKTVYETLANSSKHHIDTQSPWIKPYKSIKQLPLYLSAFLSKSTLIFDPTFEEEQIVDNRISIGFKYEIQLNAPQILSLQTHGSQSIPLVGSIEFIETIHKEIPRFSKLIWDSCSDSS